MYAIFDDNNKFVDFTDVVPRVPNKRYFLYMVGEVKESIAGRKAEPTSVKTGNYLGKIYSFETINSSTIYTPVSYAKYLEYGTSRIKERRHFRNSLNRNKEKINSFVNSEIKKV